MSNAVDSGMPAAPVQDSRAMILTLGIVATISGALIVGSWQLTLEKIKANRADQLRQAVLQVLPAAKDVVTFVQDGDGLVPAHGEVPVGQRRWFAGYTEQGQLAGIAIEAAGMGFADVIRVLYGYDPPPESVIGYTVLESKETPGLGDKIIADPDFLANFQGLDVTLDAAGTALANALQVVKKGKKTEKWQIDAITGATISSKAIGRMMQASTGEELPLLRRNLERLSQAPTGGTGR
jgi:electron transport complex protein RnfG